MRTPYWQIEGGILLDLMAIPVVILFCYGLYRQWKRILPGPLNTHSVIEDLKHILKQGRFRLGNLLFSIFPGTRLFRKPITGMAHALILWGMLVLFLGTFMVLLHVIFGVATLSGAFYRWFMAATLDGAGLAVLAGAVFFLIRRLIHYPCLVEPKAREGFVLMGLLLAAVIVSGFLLEGLRISQSQVKESAFVGHWAALLMDPFHPGPFEYSLMWWIHGLLALIFIALIPFSPLVHILLAPLNAGFAETLKAADEAVFDFSAETADQAGELPGLGASTLKDFSHKRLLDFSTCLWCGRCHEVCPANLTKKRLSPKGVVVALAEWLHQGKMNDKGLIDAIGMETLFECRTCGACVEACPAFVNPLKTIWNMRQHLTMEQGSMPPNMVQAHRNMEALRRPFSTSASPDDWRRDLSVPLFTRQESEYLLWIGCAVTYENRATEVGRAMVKILNAAGVSYGILPEARCTGDPAKQMGDDYLFSQLAQANIDLFAGLGVEKIITLCPHCYHSFKHYYPPLGGRYQVIPHVSFLRQLVADGTLRVQMKADRIALHDPCYLGRHNGLYQNPREIIHTLGLLKELPRNRGNSFCCGAGGGNYWNEEEGERINLVRAKEAFDTGADTIATACPFCLLMLTDGIKNYSDDTPVMDIAELLAQHLTG